MDNREALTELRCFAREHGFRLERENAASGRYRLRLKSKRGLTPALGLYPTQYMKPLALLWYARGWSDCFTRELAIETKMIEMA